MDLPLAGCRPADGNHHGSSFEAWPVAHGADERRGAEAVGGPRQSPAAAGRPQRAGLLAAEEAADKFFPKAVEKAQRVLRAAGQDVGRLEGYVWHSNRHTFASRLAMKGVDSMTIKELGGWKTLAMVQRYAHLAPSHLQQAVERLVPVSEAELT